MPRALDIIRRYHPGVTQVVDAKRTVRVQVTSEDCSKGAKKTPNDCAMAKAFKREKDYDGAIISMGTSYLIKGDKATRFKTPESVAREIVNFDRHSDFAPGRYSLVPVCPSSTLGASKKYNSKKKKMENAAYRAANDAGRTAGYKKHKTVGVRTLQ